MTKTYDIPKQLFMEAFKRVKANAGGAGVDKQSLEDFERDLKDNLYKIWNRMSSGSYFPPAVKNVSIPKKSGGHRNLGVPTIGDRVAQMVVKLVFEPLVEPWFLSDSYGYRPNKSALEAIEVTQKRCWRYDWVLEFDIKGLFDNIPHDLLMKAVEKHTTCRWVKLYIRRWLKAPIQLSDDKEVERKRGTLQGGVISPVLSNLFLHYVFDQWMERNHPEKLWCRYADDGLVHCETEKRAKQLLLDLKRRFKECGLELHADKTKIVYCKDSKRKGKYPNRSFDFLGYTFRPRTCKSKKNNALFTSFMPAVSKGSLKGMRQKTRKMNWRNRTDLNLKEIAQKYNPVLRGWLNYYGAFRKSGLNPMWNHFNKTLVLWIMSKYKRFKGHKTRAAEFLKKIMRESPQLFVHWKIGMTSVFV